MVMKRDGTRENFSKEKIVRIVVAAGLNENQGLTLGDSLEKWADGLKTEEIPSARIKDKVFEELKKVNPQAADLYSWYGENKFRNHNIP